MRPSHLHQVHNVYFISTFFSIFWGCKWRQKLFRTQVIDQINVNGLLFVKNKNQQIPQTKQYKSPQTKQYILLDHTAPLHHFLYTYSFYAYSSARTSCAEAREAEQRDTPQMFCRTLICLFFSFDLLQFLKHVPLAHLYCSWLKQCLRGTLTFLRDAPTCLFPAILDLIVGGWQGWSPVANVVTFVFTTSALLSKL